LGSLYQKLGRTDEAEMMFFEPNLSLIQNRVMNQSMMPLLLHNFGWFYQELGRYEEAEYYFRKRKL
jgi:Tfp pilus assembly protein PilF